MQLPDDIEIEYVFSRGVMLTHKPSGIHVQVDTHPTALENLGAATAQLIQKLKVGDSVFPFSPPPGTPAMDTFAPPSGAEGLFQWAPHEPQPRGLHANVLAGFEHLRHLNESEPMRPLASVPPSPPSPTEYDRWTKLIQLAFQVLGRKADVPMSPIVLMLAISWLCAGVTAAEIEERNPTLASEEQAR